MTPPDDRLRAVVVESRCSWCDRKRPRENHRPNCPRPDERYTLGDIRATVEAALQQPVQSEGLDEERDRVDAALFRAASNVTTLCLNHGINPREFVAAIEAAREYAALRPSVPEEDK